jgi:hypothetical protein
MERLSYLTPCYYYYNYYYYNYYNLAEREWYKDFEGVL